MTDDIIRVPVKTLPNLTLAAWRILFEPEVIHFLESLSCAESPHRHNYMRIQIPFWPGSPLTMDGINRKHDQIKEDIEKYYGVVYDEKSGRYVEQDEKQE